MTSRLPKPRQRWGILGGSFDPVHNGHLHLADELANYLHLDGVIWVLSVNHPFKNTKTITSFEDRWEMLCLALNDHSLFVPSDIELKNKLSGYTIDTITSLKTTYPAVDFYFLTGTDILSDLNNWKEPKKIAEQVTLVSGRRPGSTPQANYLSSQIPITYIESRELDISSTAIRTAFREDQYDKARSMVPSAVYEYIQKRKLYVS